MLGKIKAHWRQIACVAAVLLTLYWYHDYQEQRLVKAMRLTNEQAAMVQTLEKELKINRQNAEQLAAAVKRAQTNQLQPVTYVTVQAPAIEQAAAEVTERINSKDTTLPPAALEDSDRTIVAEQPENEEYRVGVYKINFNKRRKVKAGITSIDSRQYATVGYQQDRVEALAHFKDRKLQGGSVMWTVVEW